MKKILFIIPFILLLTACGELLPETGGTTNPGSDGGETTNPGGDGGSTTNPGGDGGSTINPGGDGDGGGTSTEPVFDYTKDPFKANLYYGRSLLTTDNERNAYDLIMKTLLEFEVNESNKSNARIGVNFIERLTYLITSTVPRGTATGAQNRPQESGEFVVEAYFDVMFNMLSTARQIYDTNTPKIEDGVVKILSKLSNDMTEAQKFRVLHDAFLNNIRYSQNGFGVNNIIGGFVNYAALCEGYARSLAYLCQRAGLEVIYIEGYATYSGTGSDGSDAFDHAWIKVKIDGQWYNVDPTNNSGGALVGASGVTYTNFLMSDDEFNIDHTAGLLSDKKTPTSFGSFPASAPYSYDKDATNYP